VSQLSYQRGAIWHTVRRLQSWCAMASGRGHGGTQQNQELAETRTNGFTWAFGPLTPWQWASSNRRGPGAKAKVHCG